ncbi:Uncharacterised protein [Haemophilus parahaemolyticus]|uniref:Uncharacterized protein n=1 Tax=Haemophilus parahaemolyticus TaxID=735 RepID=A0A377HYS8_HAEPH|nr:hypothetical protein [Haemophilus parahaemolyticus]STO63362.1 Uncharacterised protein [Haemophilus parahaemolyticus]
MKPAFKTTAIAILVAFGVAACGSSGGGSSSSSNKPVTPVKPTPTPVKPTPTPVKPTPTPVKPTPTPVKPTPTPLKPTPTPVKPELKSDLTGGTWRYVDLSFVGKRDSFVYTLEPVDNAFRDDSLRGSGKVDLNAIAKGKRGKVEGVSPSDELLVNGTVQKVNAIFENQPYSTYGFLTANVNGQDVYTRFAYTIADKEGSYSLEAIRNVYAKMQTRGNATYEGNVYATVNKPTMNEDGIKVNSWSKPALDGKVTMNVIVEGNSEKTLVNRGEISSSLLGGNIRLMSSDITQDNGRISSNDGKANYNGKVGDYYTSYTSNEAKEMIGAVNFTGLSSLSDKADGKTINEYKAVFGGTVK